MPSKKIEKKPKETIDSKKNEKSQKEFLREAVSLTVGKPARNIVDFIDDKKYINEFLIAKKLDLTINQTRNILYKLSDYGFVSSIRKKDKRKGWYTYFWKIESIKALEFLKKHFENRLGQIVNQIENRESKTFYICNTCNVEFNEENALLYDFTCNECGSVFKIKDNTKLLRELKKNHERQKNELALIEKEIQGERENIEKRKEREFKKEAKKKAVIASKKRKAIKKKIVKIKAKPSKKAKKEKTKKGKKKKPFKIKKSPIKSKTKKKVSKSKTKPVKKIKKKLKAKKK
jgi:transcription factor E